jgi:hypothetical protein
LPGLTKDEATEIVSEMKTDMDDNWTPSKLVAALDKHIIS